MAFIVPEEYRVINHGRHVGNVTSAPDIGVDGYIILAGRRWKILQVDPDRMEILVEPSPGGRTPAFSGRSGSDIHPRVREMMRSLLFRDDLPTYLDHAAKEMLASARCAAREADLDRRNFLRDGTDTIWFTWTGSRVQRTLAGLGRFARGLEVQDEGIALVFEKSVESTVREAYRDLLHLRLDVETLASDYAERVMEKYDAFLSDELQCRAFANHCLDMDGALRTIALVQ